jgi:hypothetical protein
MIFIWIIIYTCSWAIGVTGKRSNARRTSTGGRESKKGAIALQATMRKEISIENH